MEHQHASMTTKLKEYEVSPSSPRTPGKLSEKDFLKSIETTLETKCRRTVETRKKQENHR